MKKLTEHWTKSTRSGDSGDCVEARTPDNGLTVEVRDSKHPDGGTLTLAADSWRTFRDAVSAGEFDL